MAAKLYEEVLSASGLSELLAADVIGRVCTRAGLDPDKLTRAELDKALPALEKALRLYLGPVALKRSLERLRALATPLEATKAAH